MLNLLKEMNPDLTLFSCQEKAFRTYGRIINGYDFSEASEYAKKNVDYSGKAYIRMISELTDLSITKQLSESLYGGLPLQTGWCIGYNSKMNGMEYHKGNEVIFAVTPLVLALGHIQDIENNTWESQLADFFYIPRNTAVEIYSTTLHLAPFRTEENPFCALIILPSETNAPLSGYKETEDPESRLLFMKNKWMLCHPDSPVAEKGAWKGIKGENIEFRHT